MSRLLDVARDLAERGYYVFACRPVGKDPIVHGGVHAATRDERELLHWWDREPDANVGINDGACGIMVLDIDPKAGADPDEVLERLGLDLRDWAHVLTGEAPEPDEQHPDSLSGVRGVHVPFRAPGMASVPRTAITGVELRARGLYTIAPGSPAPVRRGVRGRAPARDAAARAARERARPARRGLRERSAPGRCPRWPTASRSPSCARRRCCAGRSTTSTPPASTARRPRAHARREHRARGAAAAAGRGQAAVALGERSRIASARAGSTSTRP